MRRLHKQWLGRSSDTDVLSFDLSGGQCPPYTSDKRRRLSVPPAVDGLVIVSRDAARRAARQRGVDWRAELILYVVHGCLHLIGYSDKTPGGFRRMHRREDALLTELGYGRVFDRPVRARIAGRKTARVGSKRRGRS
jgi:probable rRNA maturation factor